MNHIDAASPAFFFCLVIGAAILWGLMPEFGAALFMLAWLWLLVSYPVIAVVGAVAWVLRWIIRDFLVALVVGFAGGVGARASGVFGGPERAERDRERYEDRRRRDSDRDYDQRFKG